MSHLAHDKKRLTARLNRLVGQLKGIGRMVDQASTDDDQACFRILQQLAAARGALNSLMVELIEQHFEHHVLRIGTQRKRRVGANELIKILRSFAK